MKIIDLDFLLGTNVDEWTQGDIEFYYNRIATKYVELQRYLRRKEFEEITKGLVGKCFKRADDLSLVTSVDLDTLTIYTFDILKTDGGYMVRTHYSNSTLFLKNKEVEREVFNRRLRKISKLGGL